MFVLCSDACDLTLDPNTAHTRLVLSEENRKVTHVNERQSYPDHPDRFDDYHQVLCSESLTRRCYWETEWSGDVYISVSYKEIKRKGWSDDCVFVSLSLSLSQFNSIQNCFIGMTVNYTIWPKLSMQKDKIIIIK